METDFAQMTAEILSAYDLSEADLAEKLGVSQPTVHRIKTGESKNPGFSTGRQIVEMYLMRPKVQALPKPQLDTEPDGAAA